MCLFCGKIHNVLVMLLNKLITPKHVYINNNLLNSTKFDEFIEFDMNSINSYSFDEFTKDSI